jgi:zinc protease
MRSLLALLVLTLLPAAAQAITVKTVDSPQGVETWLSEEHSSPMIAVNISFPAGSAYDPAARPGLAEMISSLLDEGAGDLNGDAFKQALESRAIRLAATVERDFLVITVTMLKENADEGFRLLALALQHPRFDADAIERMRAAQLATLKQDDEEATQIAAKAWYSAYYGQHPYAHPVKGTPMGVSAITAADIKSFVADHFVRDRVKVAVAGDMTAPQLQKYLQQLFAPLPAKTVPLPAKPAETAKPGSQTISLDEPAPVAVFGFVGPLRADPDYIPAYVANYIFGGGGFDSRLMDEVRDKRGLTYGISMAVNDSRSASVIIGNVQSQKAKISTALDVTKSEMARFTKDGANQKELDNAKTFLTGSFALQFDSNAKIARNLNGFQRSGLGPDYVEKRNAMIEAVTLAQVNAMAKKYYDPAKLVIVIAGTPAPAQAGPPKPGPAAEKR